MVLSLPSEILAQVVAYLSRRSLQEVKRVNRTFYMICSLEHRRFLNLIATPSDEHGLDHLRYLNKKLRSQGVYSTLYLLASDLLRATTSRGNPPCIRDLYVLTHMSLDILTQVETRPSFRAMLKRFAAPSLQNKIRAVEAFHEGLNFLIPQLNGLKHLHLIHPKEQRYPSRYTGKLLETQSHRLTMLSLKLPSLREFASTIVLPPFPELRTFRLHVRDLTDFEQSVSALLSGSPHLEEVDYTLITRDPAPSSSTLNVSSFPRLKSFKMTTLSPNGDQTRLDLSAPFCPLQIEEASQLESIYLNPAIYNYVVHSLDWARLTELRIHIDLNPGYLILHMLDQTTRLKTLEIIGPHGSDLRLWWHGSHPSLKNIHIGVWPDDFVSTLNILFTKAPNVEKVVMILVVKQISERGLKTVLRSILSECKRDNTRVISGCNFWDFGIVRIDGNYVELETYANLLTAVSRKFSTIKSFYGTGSLNLRRGMEREIEDDWAGEMWNSSLRVE
ncbi:hypothetical protein DL96DRAFT_1749502 [Flagelloscypha sp. PMI_526]|nr:hypothetical protein DL96DRAFT_1749502 [Flagelloscypha sp. PMI_526]